MNFKSNTTPQNWLVMWYLYLTLLWNYFISSRCKTSNVSKISLIEKKNLIIWSKFKFL